MGKMLKKKIKPIFDWLHISYEGAGIIVWSFLSTLIFVFIFPQYKWLVFIVFLFIVFTFRNPKRNHHYVKGAIYSPADGRVDDIEEGEWECINSRKYVRIGIYLSLFNVHVQRVPYYGKVINVSHKKGKKYPAFRKKKTKYNESNIVELETDRGKLIVKQIAGMITRRIICVLNPFQNTKTGEQLGVILFGSRVELYIPAGMTLYVNKGDKVKAGETLISK